MQVNNIAIQEFLRDSNTHIFNQVLKADLEDLVIDGTLIQYMDDLIVCNSSLEQCHRDSIKVLTKLAQGGYKVSKNKETETTCPVVPGDQVYLKVFRRKWNEPRREGPYAVVRATPTAVQVEGSTTWYHLNHCTRVPKKKTEKEDNRQADYAAECDKEEPETQDEVQTNDSTEEVSQGAPVFLSEEQEREENDSDNVSEDPLMLNVSNNATPSSTNREQPDFPSNANTSDNQQQPNFPRIDFSALK